MDDEAFERFDAFVRARYGISYRPWRDAGHMSQRYRSFHHMQDGRIVSNVSTARLRLRMEGETLDAVQIGAVGTLPAYRLRGFSRDLMRKALDDAADAACAFLLAEPDAAPFFERFGFREVPLFVHEIRMRCGAEAEDMLSYEQVRPWIDARCPLSDRFEIEDGAWIRHFHLMNNARSLIRRVPGCDAAIVAEGCGHTLRVYDILARRAPDIDDIARSVRGRYTRMALHVPADRAAYGGTLVPQPLPQRLMMRARVPEGPIVFPSLLTI